MRAAALALGLAAALAFSQEPEEPQEGPILGFIGHTLDAFEARDLGLSAGVLVDSVPEQTTAYAAGLRRDDVVVACDSASIITIQQLMRLVAERGIGDTVDFGVRRGKEQLTLTWVIQSNFDPVLSQNIPAPPLRVDRWVNGEAPSLQGKVTAVVFYWSALENANDVEAACKAWHEAVSPKGGQVIPVHIIFRDFPTNRPEHAVERLDEVFDFPAACATGEPFWVEGMEICPPIVVPDWGLQQVPFVFIVDKKGQRQGGALFNAAPEFRQAVQTEMERLLGAE